MGVLWEAEVLTGAAEEKRDALGRSLLLFSTASAEDMLSKGNVWYVRHYEVFFDKVIIAFMFGNRHKEVTQGRTTLVSLGNGKGYWVQLLTLPYRAYLFARSVKPTDVLTADILFYWWVFILIRFMLKAKVWLMPVYSLEEIYRNGVRSMTGLPRWAERLASDMSFATADGVLAATSCGSFAESLASHPIASKKLIITQTIADVLPSVGFFNALEKCLSDGEMMLKKPRKTRLITVGRLHREKMLEDLIRVVAFLKEKTAPHKGVILTLVGEGPERGFLEKLAKELGVLDSVIFTGAVPNEELPKYLFEADVYLSPMTGTSLREAALCGLPIVAYDIDWVHGFLKHDENALLVPRGDYKEMARQVSRLEEDGDLRARLSRNIRDLALHLWTPNALKESLRQVFG